MTASKLSTLLVSYHFATQLAGSNPCVIITEVSLDGVASHDQTTTSISYGTGGVANTLAFPNVTAGPHEIGVRMYPSCTTGAQVTYTFWSNGTWGSTFTAVFLNQ